MALHTPFLPLKDFEKDPTNTSASDLGTNTPTIETKVTVPPPRGDSRLFSGRVAGKREDSPQAIKEAYEKLFNVIEAIKKLPPEIQSQLKIPDEKTVNFSKIRRDLEFAIIDEEFWRRMKALGGIGGVFFGGQLAIRGFLAGAFHLIQLLDPNPYYTPGAMAELGWNVSAWPAFISASLGSLITSVSCCTKSNTEQNLIHLQKRLDTTIKEIQILESVLSAPREEHRESEHTSLRLGRSVTA